MSVKKYTKADGQYFKVINKSSGLTLMYGELNESNELNTVHNVEFISEAQYEGERPKPEPLSETKMM
ncbi:hypothetical protein [Acinetobacter soli]|uniref:hypothetical protein n=1 Tax=Acinetobacter soli TaxID=487316 RepID=UPI0032B33759